MTIKVTSIVHGAISIVNAVATGYGSAMGISLNVKVEIISKKGSGLIFQKGGGSLMIKKIIYDVLQSKYINNNQLLININSEVPSGMGLKSSSAVSNAVALACISLTNKEISDEFVLNSAVDASLYAKTTITGAYDDSTACYYGGFVTTDNYKRKIWKRENSPTDISAVIFLPNNKKRGDVTRLKLLSDIYLEAFQLANSGQYWKAMTLNGVLTSSLLSNSYTITRMCLENGALAASISGNGPAIAAVVRESEVQKIKSVLSNLDGRVIISRTNNQKASTVREVG
ncbi:MAG: shikimate kinase [Nitrososphaeraceae archaeon]|nr:shikimate kinase [Nitrososphaeraceae archaeon]MDW0157707.1 shikimate kinase [Nitrososphaeraceae archaeon]